MPRQKVETLKPGMRAAADVKNIDNMLIIPAGATLSERQIDVLQAWGVTEVDVELSAAEAEAADSLASLAPDLVEKFSREIQELFWECDENDPAFAEIFRLMLHRRARRFARE